MDEEVKQALDRALAACADGVKIPLEDQVVLCLNYDVLGTLSRAQRDTLVEALSDRGNDDAKGDWAKSATRRCFASNADDGKARKLIDAFKDPISGLLIQLEKCTPPPTRAIAYRVKIFTSSAVTRDVEDAFIDVDGRRNPQRVTKPVPRLVVDSVDPYVTIVAFRSSTARVFTYWSYVEAAAVALDLAWRMTKLAG